MTLQPLTAAHAKVLFPLLADKELWRYTDDRPPESVEWLRERYHRLEARHSPDGTQLWLNWAVLVPEHGCVGFVQATVFTDVEQAAVAYVIARRFWALGLGTQAVRVLLAFLVSQLRVTSVRATVDERNIASLRLLRTLGFRIIDRSDGHNVQLEYNEDAVNPAWFKVRLGMHQAMTTATRTATATIPKRRLGRTNEQVSMIGMGGFHIGHPYLPDNDAIELIHAGIDRGITFLDNSWDYNSGMSELRMGRALCVNGYRDRVFLMTKVDGRTKAAFNAQLEESLARLLTDRLDLVQFHENIRPDDADRIFAPGGAFEAAIAARAAGKIRYIGFTGHKDPAYHLHMIDLASQHDFTFDTVQMPLNVFDAHFNSFEKNVIPVAQRLDMGILGMKTFGDKNLLDASGLDPITMLHYGLNLPTSVVITGIDKPEILDQAIAAATTFKPLSADVVAGILEQTADQAHGGSYELYKTSRFFDSTFQNPSWLG